jgi:hypothetical protein
VSYSMERISCAIPELAADPSVTFCERLGVKLPGVTLPPLTRIGCHLEVDECLGDVAPRQNRDDLPHKRLQSGAEIILLANSQKTNGISRQVRCMYSR